MALYIYKAIGCQVQSERGGTILALEGHRKLLSRKSQYRSPIWLCWLFPNSIELYTKLRGRRGEWYSLCKHFLPGQRVQYAMESILQWLLLSSLVLLLLLFDSIRWSTFVHSKIACSRERKKSLAPSSYATNVGMDLKKKRSRKSLCCDFYTFFSFKGNKSFLSCHVHREIADDFCTISIE